MSSADDSLQLLSRAERLARFRATIVAELHTYDLDTYDRLNELLQIFLCLPGEAQIEVMAGMIAEVLARLRGDPGIVKRMEQVLADVRPLAAIPGEEELIGDDLAEAWPDEIADPLLQAVANSIESLCIAIDER